MDNITLGKRIKEARLLKKMTQSEVVGTFITRNMLSQIESGTATPSIKTLQYLSDVLELPLDQLIQPESTPVESSAQLTDTATEQYMMLKQNFVQKNYENALETAKEFLRDTHPYYDEGCAIYARCCLELSTSALHDEQYTHALELAKESARYALNGCYASRDIRTQALLLMNTIADRLSESLE